MKILRNLTTRLKADKKEAVNPVSLPKKPETDRRGFLKLMMAAPLAAAAGCKTYAQPRPGDGSLAEEAEISKEEATEKIKEAKSEYTQALSELNDGITNIKLANARLDPENDSLSNFDFTAWHKVLASQKDLPAENALERYIVVKKEILAYQKMRKEFFKSCRSDLMDDYERLIVREVKSIGHLLHNIAFSLYKEAEAIQNSSPKFGKVWSEQQEIMTTMIFDQAKLFN